MILFKKITDLRKWLDAQLQEGVSIGFVPTMGALHDGHISLINASREENILTVCSIFVNPTQFNDPKDFAKYPLTIEKDIDRLEECGCDVLFFPAVKEIYPEEQQAKQHVELGYLESVLEGKYRPGHFQGVCMVVRRLLEIVNPSRLYMGQKDYQQCMVIGKLIEQMGWSGKLDLRICPTLREKDGLAMSSRNMRLDPGERKKAIVIYETLQMIRSSIRPGGLDLLKENGTKMLEKAGFRVDYVEIANAKTWRS
jgi:pantoate--beta-alanine ligase